MPFAVKPNPRQLDPELAEALSAPPLAHYDVSMSLETQPLEDLKSAPDAALAVAPAPPRDNFSFKTSSLFFGSSSLGSPESMERWQPGEEPMIVLPAAPDPDMKVMASLPVDRGRAVQDRGKRREHCAQGRGQRRQPARQDAGRAARPAGREVPRQIGKMPYRSRSISRRAAKPCAARSRWRRWC